MAARPLRDLLGVLVRDLIDAEAQAAQATVDFLRRVGFVGDRTDDANDWGQLRFVRFSFSIPDLESGTKTRTIRVPLLSLLPIPLQQIDQAEYDFFVRVEEVRADVTHTMPATGGDVGVAVDLLCDIAPQDLASAKATADPRVHVKLIIKQSDLPVGVASSLRRIEQTSGDDLSKGETK